MDKSNNKKIIFELPEELILFRVIFDIIKNNGIKESKAEALNKEVNGKDSMFKIVADTAYVVAEKKIPEKKLVELLEKHLETSKETAEKILSDIKEKLIPYAKEVSPTEDEKENSQDFSAQELILEKIRNNPYQKQTIPLSEEPIEKVKNIEIKNVEENADKLKRGGKRGPDTYRETIE